MGGKKTEPLIVSAVIGAATEGKTTSEIMELTGLTEKKIQQIARGAGLKIRRSTSRIPDDVRAKIAEMHAEGHTRREIAAAFGISTRSVSTYIPKMTDEAEADTGDDGAGELQKPSTNGPTDDQGAQLATAIRMHAEAITKLAEAIALAATAGKETVIKLKTDKGVTLASDTGLTLYKVERRCPDWEHKTEKQESKEETK